MQPVCTWAMHIAHLPTMCTIIRCIPPDCLPNYTTEILKCFLLFRHQQEACLLSQLPCHSHSSQTASMYQKRFSSPWKNLKVRYWNDLGWDYFPDVLVRSGTKTGPEPGTPMPSMLIKKYHFYVFVERKNMCFTLFVGLFYVFHDESIHFIIGKFELLVWLCFDPQSP